MKSLKISGTPSRRTKRQQRGTQLCLERLEPRELFALGVFHGPGPAIQRGFNAAADLT